MQTQDELNEVLNLITSFIPYFYELSENSNDYYKQLRLISYYVNFQENFVSIYNSFDDSRVLSFMSEPGRLLCVSIYKTIHIENNRILFYKDINPSSIELCEDTDKDSIFNYTIDKSTVFDNQEMQIALHFSKNKIPENGTLLIDDMIEVHKALKELQLNAR